MPPNRGSACSACAAKKLTWLAAPSCCGVSPCSLGAACLVAAAASRHRDQLRRDALGHVGKGLARPAERRFASRDLHHRVRRFDPHRPHLPVAHLHLSRDHDAGSGSPFGHPSHADDDLATGRLGVERALAGDQQVGACEFGRQPEGVSDSGDARHPMRAQHQQRPAEAAGRAGTRRLLLAARPLSLARCSSAASSLGLSSSRDALLRAEDVGRATQSQQRVVDVGRREQLDPADRLVRRGEIHRLQAAEGLPVRLSARRTGSTRRSQRGQQPGAAVVGAAAAEPDDDPLRPLGRGRRHQFADARAGRSCRVARRSADAGAGHRPGRSRRTRSRPPAGSRPAPGHRAARTPSPTRARRRARPTARRRSPARRRPSAAAPVRLPAPARPARGDGLGRLHGGQGAGELVRSDEDAHGRHCAVARSGPAGPSVSRLTSAAGCDAGNGARCRRRLEFPGCPPCRRSFVTVTTPATARPRVLPHPAAAGPGSDPASERGVDCPGELPAPSDPTWSSAPPRPRDARRPGVRARPPLPARRGHPVRRRDRRLVQARPRGRRPAGRRVHRLLRRALHGRERRHPHQPTPSR